MADHTLRPKHTLIVGMTGSGKTTWVINYLLNTRPACRFIFDDLDRVWPRLKIRPCYTEADLEASLVTRWSIFQPSRMFPLAGFKPKPGIPTPKHEAFRWWLRWVDNVSKRGPGPKPVCVPEFWRFNTADSIPLEFAMFAQAGREQGVELVLDTQRPENVNPSITGACPELICFKLLTKEALNAVHALGASKSAVATLPMGRFIGYDLLTGGSGPGRVF